MIVSKIANKEVAEVFQQMRKRLCKISRKLVFEGVLTRDQDKKIHDRREYAIFSKK